MLEFFKSIISEDSKLSSKSLTLVISAITGSLLILTICVCLLIDAVKNGYIRTDLGDLGIFILFIGGYIAGSGVNKAIFDSRRPRDERRK